MKELDSCEFIHIFRTNCYEVYYGVRSDSIHIDFDNDWGHEYCYIDFDYIIKNKKDILSSLNQCNKGKNINILKYNNVSICFNEEKEELIVSREEDSYSIGSILIEDFYKILEIISEKFDTKIENIFDVCKKNIKLRDTIRSYEDRIKKMDDKLQERERYWLADQNWRDRSIKSLTDSLTEKNTELSVFYKLYGKKE